MEIKTIFTEDYILLIDEKTEIKRGDYLLEKERIINVFPDYLTDLDEYDKIIAYRKLNEETKDLDLPELPNPFNKIFDITELAEKEIPYNPHDSTLYQGYRKYELKGFIRGYKAAQSNPKQFSLEDIKKAINFDKYHYEYGNIIASKNDEEIENFIQSLSTRQSPKEFIPEYQKDWKETTKMLMESMGDNPEDFKYEETLKTITNSSGKIELVGTWKY